MDDDGVKIDFRDRLIMIGGDLRQPHHEVGERVDVRGGWPR
jgi:hypothetical protein